MSRNQKILLEQYNLNQKIQRMNYSRIFLNSASLSKKIIARPKSQYAPSRFNIDLTNLNFSLKNKSIDFTQTATNFYTEQKPKSYFANNTAPSSIQVKPVFKRIDLALDKYNLTKTEIKSSTKRFDALHNKIDQHLKKIANFLSNNQTEISKNKTFQKAEQEEKPNYLQIKQRNPCSQSFHAKAPSISSNKHHYTNFANFLFFNGMTNLSKLKNYLFQLKSDLADRERVIRNDIGRTQHWQNVCLGPREQGKVKTLVLDLDETLIHSSFDSRRKLKMYEPSIPCSFDFRPFLKDFMEKCNKVFEIVIFTASEDKYTNALVNRIKSLCNYSINIKKILDRKFLNSLGQKDLSIMKDRDLKDMIFIDNIAMCFANGQLDNGIPILEWTGDSRDKELYKIPKFLFHAEKSEDVRYAIRDMFNLEKFVHENIEWDAVEAMLANSPISGQCSF